MNSLQNSITKEIVIRSFGTPPERIVGGYVSLVGLYHIIKDSQIIKETGSILDNNDYERNLMGRNPVTQKHYSNPCFDTEKQRLQRVQILVGGLIYRLNEEGDSHHVYGSGGENITHTFLNRDGKPILMSAQYLSYDTLSDDSEDGGGSCIRRTELLDPEDELARVVFEEIKRLALA